MPKKVQAEPEISYARSRSVQLIEPHGAVVQESAHATGKIVALSRVGIPVLHNGHPPAGQHHGCDMKPVRVDYGTLRLARAVDAGERLRDAADAANAVFQRAQTAIAKLKLGVSGSIDLHADEEGWHQRLAYEKHLGAWGLYLHSGWVGHESEWKVTPIVHASRTVRALALKSIPRLIHELICCAESQAEEIDHDVRVVSSILDRIDAGVAR